MILKTKMKHSGSKSKQKYFGLGRVTPTFGVFAASALICVGLVSGTVRGATYKIDDVMAKVMEVESKIDTLTLNSGDSGTEIITAIGVAKDEIKLNTNTEVGNATTSINGNIASLHQLVTDTHLINPFDVAVNICTEIEGGAAMEGNAVLGIGASLEAHLGVDFYGSGAQIGIEPAGEITGGLNIRSDVETYVTACINGVFARQIDDFDNNTDIELAALLATFANDATTDRSDFVTELYDVGKRYRDRVLDTAKNTSLVTVPVSEGAYNPNNATDPGSDRLNNSLDAYEAFSTLNIQGIANIIVNTGGSGTPTALDDFAGSVSGFGVSCLFDGTSGLPSVVSLSSSGVDSIGQSITSGLTALGLGTGGSGGLGGLGSAAGGFSEIVDAFGEIPGVIEGVGDAIEQVGKDLCSVANLIIPGSCTP